MRLAITLMACLAALASDAVVTETPLNETTGGCLGKEPGLYPPWTMTDAQGLAVIPWPPYCPDSYIECEGDGGGVWVQGDLPELEAPDGTQVPSIFNWITRNASLPGAIGSRGCECDNAYGSSDLATACQACSALQFSGLCDHRRAVANSSFTCYAPFPGKTDRHVVCSVEGPSVESGGLQSVDPAVQDLIDIEFGIKEPSKRFAVMVNQDLGDPQLQLLLTDGTDEDQFMRLLREPGQKWSFYNLFQTDRFPDGQFPTDEELEQLDGFVLTGDEGALPDRISEKVFKMIRKAADNGARIVGTCYGLLQINRAFGGISLSMAQYHDPTLDKLEFGAANVTVSAPARAAVNASWAALIPDTYVVNEMHQNAVYALPPGAIHLGWSQRVPVEMFVAGPYLNALAFQGHPEANRRVVETFAAGAPAQAIAGVNGCLSRMPPEQAAQLCPAWEIKWVLDSVGRMHASYVQYTGDESREQLQAVMRAFLNDGSQQRWPR